MPARQRPFDDERVRRVFEFICIIQESDLNIRNQHKYVVCEEWIRFFECVVKHVERGVFKVNAIR